MSDWRQQERSLFLQALEMETAERRCEFLNAACADNRQLRAAVEALLAAHGNSPSLLRTANSPARPTDLPSAKYAGTCIGPYKLLEQIGEGGFGVVYLAEQRQPVRRQVALKILKPGMDTRQIVARFEAERQALALMDHPNIAKVFDGGMVGDVAPARLWRLGEENANPAPPALATSTSHSTGRPYFVMELVRGAPITQYCDQNALPLRQRLELFITVCQAVQHAHLKGIIHRDLKPSNVLVVQYDGAPLVKVIDFGVAKAIGQALTDKTVFTGIAQVIGTPLYMSPEQAGQDTVDIDTRSDIYALGVQLYELLTGTTPFPKERFQHAPYDEIFRIIREEEPPRPSTRLSEMQNVQRATQVADTTVTAGPPTAAAHTALRTANLRELDWIVMQALEKDRSRRYESASALALDVQRYLANEPVLACPPSAAYRLQKFLRRHRGPVIAASLLLAALVAGVVGTSLGMWRANLAWRAEAQRAVAEQQAKETAQKRLAQIEQGLGVLNSIFADLDPRAEEKEGRPLRAILAERVLQASQQLDGELIGDPVIVAGLQSQLGNSLQNLGLAEDAVKVLLKARETQTSALGANHSHTLETTNHLAVAYKYAGNIGKATELHEEALELRKTRLGPDHPATLESLNNLAAAYRDNGKVGQALPLHEEALRLRQASLGPEHADTLVSMNNLALSYHVAAQFDRAVPLFERTLELRKQVLGPRHRSTLASMNNLALSYKTIGKTQEALVLEEETLALKRETLGPDHPDTLTSYSNLAHSYKAVGKIDLALSMFEEILKLMKAKLGERHPDTLRAMNNRAITLSASGKPELALPLAEECLRLRREVLGNLHTDTLTSLGNLARELHENGKLEQALPLFAEAAAGIESLAFRHIYADATINNLIAFHEKLGHFDQAESWRRKWLAVVEQKDGTQSAKYAVALEGLAANLLGQKKFEAAEAALEDATAILDKTPLTPQFAGQHRKALERVVELYENCEKPAGASRWRETLEAISAR